ncbi:MAG TPA: hypothetical protein ENK39_03175 [Epsilonproteobacteria bacterium]|nr:hypothetical protein [Campylobacterota bacterium]
MKRKMIYAFMVTLALILSACGGNSIEDATTGQVPTTPDTNSTGKITTALQGITIDKNTGDVAANIVVTSTYDNTVIATLDKMDLTLGGCTLVGGSVQANPDSITLNTTNPSRNVVLSGKMTDSNCIPTSYQLSATNTLVDNNGKTTVENFIAPSQSVNLSQITINDSSILSLSVATKQLDINESGVENNITVNVLQGSVGAANKNVKITSLSGIIGSFVAQSVVSDAAGDAVFTYTSPNPIVDSNFTVEFCLEDNTSVCDTAKINLTTGEIVTPPEAIDNINYFITFLPNGGVNNLALGTRNNAIVTLIDKDSKVAIPNERIKSITVTSRDASVLKLTPEGGGTPATNIAFGSNRNNVSVLLTADDQNSGLAIVEVIIEYTNLNGVLKTRGQLFSVAVLSGAPTAFSINDDGVGYNANTKQFEHKFIVQATDASGNPIATTGFINVSAMASFAKDATGREILYGRHSGGVSATLSPNSGKATLDLIGLAPFNTSNIKLNRAFVAIFGDVETYEANGKWDIENIISGNTLDLSNEYQGGAHTGLGMAVGYNFRDKFCTSGFEESVVVVDSTDGSYRLDEKGQAFVTLKYDSYMVGKRAMILVNMTGLDPNTGKVLRTGEVHEQTLKFHDFLKGITVSVKGGETKTFRLWGVITTGTGDTHALINSRFSCTETVGTDNISVISRTFSDPTSCVSGGQAFIDYTITTVTGEDGSFVLSECRPDNRPDY